MFVVQLMPSYPVPGMPRIQVLLQSFTGGALSLIHI